jgi:hypothetical protein
MFLQSVGGMWDFSGSVARLETNRVCVCVCVCVCAQTFSNKVKATRHL